MKTIEITAKVTQTLTRTYQIEVPTEQTKGGICELVESFSIPSTNVTNESIRQDVKIEVLAVTDKSAELLKTKKEHEISPKHVQT